PATDNGNPNGTAPLLGTEPRASCRPHPGAAPHRGAPLPPGPTPDDPAPDDPAPGDPVPGPPGTNPRPHVHHETQRPRTAPPPLGAAGGARPGPSRAHARVRVHP